MAISSSSTLTEIQAQMDDNCDYDLESSVAKVKLFIHACRMKLARLADEVEHAGERVKQEYRRLAELLGAAVRWWRSNDTAAATDSSVSFYDFGDLRK